MGARKCISIIFFELPFLAYAADTMTIQNLGTLSLVAVEIGEITGQSNLFY